MVVARCTVDNLGSPEIADHHRRRLTVPLVPSVTADRARQPVDTGSSRSCYCSTVNYVPWLDGGLYMCVFVIKQV